VDDLQVNDTTYRITASGNGYTSSGRVHDFVLLRASEIAIKRGYEGFVIGDMSDQTRVNTLVSPGQVTTSSTGNPFPVNGVVTPQHVTTTVTPPSISTVVKPGFITFITLVREGGMDAKMIYASLAPKYEAPPMPVATSQMGSTDGVTFAPTTSGHEEHP
jgi:hypothetical protein